MKHLKLFEQFIFEKMGVPAGLMGNADEITKIVLDELIEMHQKGKDRATCYPRTVGPDFPEGTLVVKLVIEESDNMDIAVSGGITPKTMQITEDGRYQIDMNFTAWGEQGDLTGYGGALDWVKGRVDLEKRMKLERELRRAVTHELLHVVEAYIRRTTKGKDEWMENIETLMYSDLSTHMRRYKIPHAIKEFLFLIYVAQAHEVSARVPEAYAMVDLIEDPHKRLEIIKGSNLWQRALDMSAFSAEDYIDQAKDEFEQIVTNDTWENFKRVLGERMTHLLKMSSDDHFAFLTAREDRSNAAKKMLPNKRSRSTAAATEDIEKMMRRWEGVINRAGDKLRRKLAKLTTA